MMMQRMSGMGGFVPVTPPLSNSQTIIVKDEGSDTESDEEKEAVPMRRELKPVEDLLSSTADLMNKAQQDASLPYRSQDMCNDNLRAVINAKQVQMEMIKEKSQLTEQLARSEAAIKRPIGSQISSYSDTLQPQKARKPQATETNTAFGVTKTAKVQRQTRKRKEVDIPDVDLSDINSFNVVPASQKFRSWLTKCLKNGNRSFTKGDAAQLTGYAAKHAEQYFALKDGWVRALKGLDDSGEVLKAWYAYDALLNMKEFANEAVRATWVVKLPDLIAEYMDFSEEGGWAEKYNKLITTWRSRIDFDTMSSITRKLASRGVTLSDAMPTSTFPYKIGAPIDFFSEKVSEWIPASISSINQSAKTVVVKPTTAGLPSSTITFSQAVSLVRKSRQKSGHEAKRRKANNDSPKF
eukprot:TRINITY_DN1857_c0_g1_i9.p1 TRINITY_DN1857_c0_g1~~TRINITY_DN1857_c0_g1_i9.p1  ORF type:complete len:409 (+),score=86.18 TRINITY_DN1857_c0_g1_i9:15-1241(+)